MKILQINSVCGIGSSGRIAADIHNTLIGLGHTSYIAYGRELPRSCDNTIKICTKYDNYVHALMTRATDKHGFGSRKATEKFIKEVEQINPNVLQLHNIHGYYINIEVLFNYIKAFDKPVVWTLHDCWAFTGHCSHFDYFSCNKWKNGCYECPQKQSYPKSIIKDNSKYNYNRKKELFTGIRNMTIIAPSNWLSGLIKESFLAQYPVEVINNGIDLDVFKPTESELIKNYNIAEKFIILGVAYDWVERKGFNYFIELSKNLEEDEIIILVGLTKQQIKKLPEKILGFTRTNEINELAQFYSVADVFVNPTLEEVMGLVNVESLACGTPVITFKSGGSSECIDENCGYEIKKGDLGKLIFAIKEIKRNGKSKYSSYCISRAKTLFNKKDRINDYIDLYKKMSKYNN